jgi:hypothetical protein
VAQEDPIRKSVAMQSKMVLNMETADGHPSQLSQRTRKDKTSLLGQLYKENMNTKKRYFSKYVSAKVNIFKGQLSLRRKPQ